MGQNLFHQQEQIQSREHNSHSYRWNTTNPMEMEIRISSQKLHSLRILFEATQEMYLHKMYQALGLLFIYLFMHNKIPHIFYCF